MSDEPYLQVRNLTHVFGGKPVLDDVGFTIERGEFVALLGPSGCGKSTILNILAGFIAPTHGNAWAHGQPIAGPSPRRGVVFQDAALFPWLSVHDNLAFPLKARSVRRSGWEALIERMLDSMELSSFRSHLPHELSGGMKQRVAIGRVLINEPDVLLMDEPFGALDAQTRLRMQDFLLRIYEQIRPTVVFVTHDIDEAIYLSDRILIMSAHPGRIVRVIAVAEPRPRTRGFLTSEQFMVAKRDIMQTLTAVA